MVATLVTMVAFSAAIKGFVFLIVAARQSAFISVGEALCAGRPGPFAFSAALRR